MSDDLTPLDNRIEMYYHCGRCIKEKPEGISPRDWAMNEVGASKIGIQVWCKRHECNVMHMDLESHQHPAYLEVKPTEAEMNAAMKGLRELTKEEKEAREEQEFERDCDKIINFMGRAMHGAPAAFGTVLPTIVGTWLATFSESPKDCKDLRSGLIKAVDSTIKSIEENTKATI